MMKNNLARSTGVMIVSQGVFFALGYCLHLLLARMGGPSLYGNYVFIMSILVWFEVPLSSAVPMAVKKYTAQDISTAAGVLRTGMKTQMLLASLFLLLIICLAPLFSLLFNDPALTSLIIIAGIDIPLFALYFIFVGSINGAGHYVRLACASSSYAAGKLLFTVLLFSWAGLKGAFIGNAAASLFAAGLGIFFSRNWLKSKSTFPVSQILDFSFPIIFLAVASHLLLNLDLFFVKLLVKNPLQVGFYSMAATLSRLPYVGLLAMVAILFPSLAKSIHEKNNRLNALYVRQANRFFTLITFPFVAIITGHSEAVISMLFSDAFVPAGPMLRILAVAFLFYGYYYIISNVVLADNKPTLVLKAEMILIGVTFIANVLLVPAMGSRGAALAFLVTSLIACAIGILMTFKKWGLLFDWKSMGRIILASAAILGLMGLVRFSGFFFALELLVVSIIYLVLLLLLKEIKLDEVQQFRKAVARKAGGVAFGGYVGKIHCCKLKK